MKLLREFFQHLRGRMRRARGEKNFRRHMEAFHREILKLNDAAREKKIAEFMASLEKDKQDAAVEQATDLLAQKGPDDDDIDGVRKVLAAWADDADQSMEKLLAGCLAEYESSPRRQHNNAAVGLQER